MSKKTITLDAVVAAGTAFLEPPDVAVIMGADERTIRSAIRAGDIPAVRVGQRWKVPVNWLVRAASGEIAA